MSVYEKLNEQHGHFRQKHTDMVFGKLGRYSYEDEEEVHDGFREAMETALANLTPDEKVEYFQLIVEELENELEDMWAEMYPGETIKVLLKLQVFKQLIPKE